MLTPRHVAVLIVFALMFQARAATPTTNPADLDREVVRELLARPDPIEQADDLDAVPIDAALAKYVNDRRPLLALMRQAAAMPHADWGPIDGDVWKTMPPLNGTRGAAILTWVAARYDATQGRYEDAVDELLSGIALARHVGQRPLLVTEMVEIGAEYGSIERLAELLPALPADLTATLPARLDALPPRSSFAAVIDGEREFGRRMLAQQFPAAALPATRPAGPTTRTGVVAAMASGLDVFYDAAKSAADTSPAVFATAVNVAAAKMPLNVMARTLAPSLGRIREPGAKVEAKWAMLRAAAVIVVEGPAAVEAFRDPFGTGPFAYMTTEHGFRLTSALVAGPTPVTLTVGPASDAATQP